MPVVPENLERDIAIIKKRRENKDVVHKGSEQQPVVKIPVDSPALMRITEGGMPLGRMTRFWGGPSSGKSLVAFLVIKAAQEMLTPKYHHGLECVYYNIEKQYDPKMTKVLGIDTDRLRIVESTIIEDVARECQLLLQSAHVHVIDSTSSAVPQDRLNKDPGDWDVGLDARVWIKALDYLLTAMDKDENSIIYISHASQNFTTKQEKPLGGKEMEHESSMTIQFTKGKWLFYDDEGMLQTEDKLKEKGMLGFAGGKEADGQEFHLKVSKSRVCRPNKIANIRYDFKQLKFDYTFELMQGAEYYDGNGQIAHRSGTQAIAHRPTKQGGWVTLPDGNKIQGERALRQMIEADKDLARLIRQAMLAGN